MRHGLSAPYPVVSECCRVVEGKGKEREPQTSQSDTLLYVSPAILTVIF